MQGYPIRMQTLYPKGFGDRAGLSNREDASRYTLA
jgi:hypothetical protein